DNPERYAEELVEQYLDWGVSHKGLEHVYFVRRFDRVGAVEAGSGLQWLRVLADDAAGYSATLLYLSVILSCCTMGKNSESASCLNTTIQLYHHQGQHDLLG